MKSKFVGQPDNIVDGSMKHRFFSKRSFSFRSFIRYIALMFKQLPSIMPMLSSAPESRLSAAFQERIMMAVTAVNDCRYCSFFHAKMALEAGCSDDEIEQILGSELSCVDPGELPALAFAQHFAESHEHPSPIALKRLLQVYGRSKTGRILLACMGITMGNLLGNTIDAYESRLLGKPAQSGSAWFEGLIYYLSVRPMRRMVAHNRTYTK